MCERGWKANRGEVSSHSSRLHAPAKLPFDLFASRKCRVTSVAPVVSRVLDNARLLLASVFIFLSQSIDRPHHRLIDAYVDLF